MVLEESGPNKDVSDRDAGGNTLGVCLSWSDGTQSATIALDSIRGRFGGFAGAYGIKDIGQIRCYTLDLIDD